MQKRKKTGGRVAGTPNKSTEKAREAIAAFVDFNAPRFREWLEEIYAQDGPKEAFYCVSSLLEYHMPKLGRVESENKTQITHVKAGWDE